MKRRYPACSHGISRARLVKDLIPSHILDLTKCGADHLHDDIRNSKAAVSSSDARPASIAAF